MTNNNELEKFLDSLPEDNRRLIKGIYKCKVKDLLKMDSDHFRAALNDSISLTELSALDEETLRYREQLVDQVFGIWSATKLKQIEESQQQQEDEEEENKPTQAEILIDLASENIEELFPDQSGGGGNTYASINVNSHREILKIDSSKVKRFLAKLFYDQEGKPIRTETINTVIQLLQAKAEFEGKTIPLFLRTAWHGNDIYYDLTNEKWQSIRITDQGWELVDKTPSPLFLRYNQIAQTVPDTKYEADIFGQFLKLTNVKDDSNKLLLRCYIIALFIPEIPKAILQLHGAQGSAKSTLQKLIKLLVDPSKPKLLTAHNDRMEFVQQLAQNYVAFYDNLKYASPWLSDESCRAVTGVGNSKRKLYTDEESVVYEYKRCLGFNGINLALTEPDALDRSIMIELDRISDEDKKPEEEIIPRFLELRPRLLGYIFDILVKALQIKPTLKLTRLPRMADFAVWCEAISRAMGYEPMKFLRAYYENIGKQNVEAIENNILGDAFTKFFNSWYNQPNGQGEELLKTEWLDTTSNLLDQLNTVAAQSNINTNSKYWPKSTASLTRKLRQLGQT